MKFRQVRTKKPPNSLHASQAPFALGPAASLQYPAITEPATRHA